MGLLDAALGGLSAFGGFLGAKSAQEKQEEQTNKAAGLLIGGENQSAAEILRNLFAKGGQSLRRARFLTREGFDAGLRDIQGARAQVAGLADDANARALRAFQTALGGVNAAAAGGAAGGFGGSVARARQGAAGDRFALAQQDILASVAPLQAGLTQALGETRIARGQSLAQLALENMRRRERLAQGLSQLFAGAAGIQSQLQFTSSFPDLSGLAALFQGKT
jgi:hypothetical protein